MRTEYIKHTLVFITFLLLYSCESYESNDQNSVENNLSESSIDIPDGFGYNTYREVNINIQDDTQNVIYDVFAYSDDPLYIGESTFENYEGETITESIYREDSVEKKLFSISPVNGIINSKVNLPTFCNKIYIRRKYQLNYSAEIVNITNNNASFNYNSSSNKQSLSTLITDDLYCVNSSAQLFKVNPLTGAKTDLATMPMGSVTAAIDQVNGVLYSIGNSSPYPLMKYTIATNTWETISNLTRSGPRLDFKDNTLYFSHADKLYTIDVTVANPQLSSSKKINGIHNLSGGDLAFRKSDDSLFMCSFSGLYKLEYDSNSDEYNSIYISADGLPFSPTSMTFDKNHELWLANMSGDSDLIIMDTQTGGYQYQYGPNSSSGVTYGRTINDLTTLQIVDEDYEDIDTDGDGILDNDDSFPNDNEKAFEEFTPSRYGNGTVAFEDLWPLSGDYDFNDLALKYRVIVVLNSNNDAVQVDFICNIKSNMAGFTNGIGIEIEGLTSPSTQIESVTGTTYTEGYINLNSNGTEAGQDNAVVILTDNPNNLLNETTISIKLTNPISTSQLGTAPFKPFLIVNKVRANEVHLKGNSKTTLGNNISDVGGGNNNDPDGDYLSNTGFPWAINIIHDFKVPKESISIRDAYNNFENWATSGGSSSTDWYKDTPGNRNDDKLQD